MSEVNENWKWWEIAAWVSAGVVALIGIGWLTEPSEEQKAKMAKKAAQQHGHHAGGMGGGMGPPGQVDPVEALQMMAGEISQAEEFVNGELEMRLSQMSPQEARMSHLKLTEFLQQQQMVVDRVPPQYAAIRKQITTKIQRTLRRVDEIAEATHGIGSSSSGMGVGSGGDSRRLASSRVEELDDEELLSP
eukprot:TRINITY_DN2593_c0_g1_i2.p1 TRINITY_DN2593_c0_g1~~TRINITY_DN2593_c0_g1_i2.p1  ORF type:complete len:190 (+),score=46.37 TRINITY_DN2593_c0_g1_i2:956-1525(+)